MRWVLFPVAVLASVPAAAQSVIQPAEASRDAGPNAQVAQRPPGPNARAAQRPAGPNIAIVRESERRSGEVFHPSCSALGAVREGPVRRGEPGYGRHLDPDGDGVTCD